MTKKDDIRIYFKCYRGANAHLGLPEPDSFTLNDAAGRDWICYPVPKHVVENLDMLSDLVDVQRADDKSGNETIVRLVFCQDTKELSVKLADESAKDDDSEGGKAGRQ
jgi:hypothetical protein